MLCLGSPSRYSVAKPDAKILLLWDQEFFYFPDRESIVTEQKIDFEILTDLYVLRSQECEKVDFKKCLSVCMSVCPLWRSE